ncbi:MAG: ABC transporter permease [Candidatus Eisenbacteria sp.]|nr:ABC transporter permease [Candidatus Eisenbacteria bacterium]
MLRGALLLALNDLRQTIKDRPTLFWMIIMPVGFIFLFGQMGGGSGGGKVSLTVIDEDQTYLSEAFAEALGHEGFSIQRVGPAERDSLGRIRRSVTVPPGFQDSLMHAQSTPVFFYVDPDASSEASVTAEMHIQRASFSTLFSLTEANPAGKTWASPTDPGFQQRFAEIAARPRLIQVASETAGRGRPVPSGMRQSLPATIALFMLINTTIYGAVFLATEKQEGILARIASQPLHRVTILGGKILGALAIGLAQAGILLLAGRFLLGAYLGNSLPGLLLVIVCFGLAASSMALFWGAILRRPEQVTATTLVVALFLGAIGGCWWPLEVVPQWMRTMGHISPAAWAMDGFHAIISFGAGIGAVVVPCLILLGYAAVFFGIGARLLRFSD